MSVEKSKLAIEKFMIELHKRDLSLLGRLKQNFINSFAQYLYEKRHEVMISEIIIKTQSSHKFMTNVQF